MNNYKIEYTPIHRTDGTILPCYRATVCEHTVYGSTEEECREAAEAWKKKWAKLERSRKEEEAYRQTAEGIAFACLDGLDRPFVERNLRNGHYNSSEVRSYCRDLLKDYIPDGASQQLIGRAASILKTHLERR